HATSKLRDERGLEAIGTLGFRGEALAAISSVSRVELITKQRGAEEGISLSLDGGVVVSKTPAGCPEGTTMIVRDLFYNTPARLKFMKSDRAEGASCSAAVLRCALSHPEVSVRYIKDGHEELHTSGDGRMDSCIYSIFGREMALGLIPCSTESDGIKVEGFVSAPHAARGNRSYQFFFVNGRHIKSKTLQTALEQAYKNSLFTGKYPSCVLYITMSHAAVDVNVHPTKTEVKFLNEKKVFDGVYYAALAALGNETKHAEITLSPSTEKKLGGYERITAEDYKKRYVPKPEKAPTSYTPAPKPRESAPAMLGSPVRGYDSPAVSVPKPIAPPKKTLRDSVLDKPPVPLPSRDDEENEDEPENIPANEENPVCAEPEIKTIITEEPKEPEEQLMLDLGSVPDYRIIGEAMNTYIIVERGSSLWLIDKHAAHERIHFDRLKKEGAECMTQTLLMPVICRVGREDAALLLDNAELLTRFGLAVEPLGSDAVALREIPADLLQGEAESALGEICEKLRRGCVDDSERADKIMHTLACKAAVKAGMKSDPAELAVLVEKVMSGEVRYCPHGRPITVELT
ncbi:MAG: DNA mismatch repair protein MutL, partial [Oscillospiraceae bacterium]|nr:DNA mismatch repair protein MutL [Oscillospiraceae bacterium]